MKYTYTQIEKTRHISQLGVLQHTTRLVAMHNLAYYEVQLGLLRYASRLLAMCEQAARDTRAGCSSAYPLLFLFWFCATLFSIFRWCNTKMLAEDG